MECDRKPSLLLHICISWGVECTKCRTVVSYLAKYIVALVEKPYLASLGDFAEGIESLLPQKMPAADKAMVINVILIFYSAFFQSSRRRG